MGRAKHFTVGNFIVCAVHLNIARMIKSRRLRWAVNVARMKDCRSAFKILTDKHTVKRPLGRPKRR